MLSWISESVNEFGGKARSGLFCLSNLSLPQKPFACCVGLAAVGVAALIAVPGEARAGAYMYGITGDGQIIEYNPETKDAPKVLTTIASSTNGNGLAYDFNATTNRERIWTFDTAVGLRYYDRATNFLSNTIVTNEQLNSVLGLSGASVPEFRNAAFYDGSYWFIVPSSISSSGSRLARISFNYDVNGVPTFRPFNTNDGSSSTSFLMPTAYTVGGSCADLRCGRFGDIAITPSGILYGSNEDYFFRLNITNLVFTPLGSPSVPNILQDGRLVKGLVPGCIETSGSLCVKRDVLQLSFNSSNTTLYGVNNFTGNWYTLTTSTDPATLGARSLINGYNTTNISDLGGASASSGDPNPVPGPLPLLGAGAAFQASRRLRCRIRRA